MNRQIHNYTARQIHNTFQRERKRLPETDRKLLSDRHTDKYLMVREKKRVDNRFPIIFCAGNIVLLSRVMPIRHD